MSDTESGGKEEVSGSPTDTELSVDAGTGGKEEVSGSPTDTEDGREQFVPRERFDDAIDQLHQLRAEIAAVKAGTNKTEQQASWETASDSDLNKIIANPIEYPNHVAKALEEKERRMEMRILNKTNEQFALQNVQSQNPEAFDQNTPLGREVSKILGQQSYAENLKSVIELAKFKTNKDNLSSKARKKMVENIKTATETVHGSDDNKQENTSYMDMDKKDFFAELNKIKMGNRI